MVMGMFFFLVMPVFANAEEQPSAGKIINVVYDDSRSMFLDNETRWCQAKYAMEVFCAMMDENDIMNIYAMNRSDILTIDGGDPLRVEKVHAMTSTYAGTPFSAVTKAGNDLINADETRERWLVILTDGSFDDTSKSTVQNTLDGYNDAGIKTVYLAIGTDAVALAGNSDNGSYAEVAMNTQDILSKVTSIANQIFEHQVLGYRFIGASDKQTLLNIDIPTNQIIVFAQGEGASVGQLSLNGKTINPTRSQSVKHSGDVMPLNDEEIAVDTSLYGVVVVYDSGGEPFESGQFAIEVSNVTNVEYYYRPGVTVKGDLLYEGSAVQLSDELYAGNYEVAMSFIDPFTGNVIESELLSSAEFTLTLVNNGQEQVVSDKTGSFALTEGEVDISVVAELPGNVFLSDNNQYVVLPEPIDLNLIIDEYSNVYTPDKLGENAVPIHIAVENAETGESLGTEEWDNTEILVEETGGISWLIKKGEQVGTWELRPASKDGTLTGVDPGDYKLAITAAYQIGNQYAFGAETLTLTLEPYTGNVLQVQIEDPSGAYDLNDMDSPSGLQVAIQYENPQTGEFTPLTEEMWDALSVRAKSDRHVSWSIEKGTEVGTWILTPGYYHGDILATANGQVEVVIEAEGDVDAYHFAGSASQQTEFVKLSWENIAKILGPRIIIGLAIIWLIVGYIKKNRLRTRGLNPRCRFKDSTSPKQKISKSFFSVVLPYVPEKATVRCHKSAFQCNFPDLIIQATGRRSFKILNKSIPLKTTKICGEFYEDMETLRNRKFSFGSFDIASVNPKIRNRTLGTFTFK